MAKVVLLVSRNKDNKDVPGFKERKRTFFDTSHTEREFENFVSSGQPGEFCRMYISVNDRDMNKVRKALICRLTTDEDINLTMPDKLVAGIAIKGENAAEHKWLFDFDCDDTVKLHEFLDDISHYVVSAEYFKTPHGYAVVAAHGFDTREILAKWQCVELKKDAMLCVKWDVNAC